MPNINHSKIDTWQTCQMRYKLEYVDGVAETPQPALILGRAVHAAIDTDNLRGMYSGSYADLGLLLREGRETLLKEIAKVDPHGSLGDLVDLQLRMEALLTAYVAYVQGKYRPLASEKPFKFRLPETTEELRNWNFTGRIDGLMLDADGNKLIVDYKTGKNPWNAGEEHTLDQATAYLWASQMLAFDAQRVAFIPLIASQQCGIYQAVAEFRTTERTPEQILAYSHSVQQVVRDIQAAALSGDYQPHPGYQCRWCSVRLHCAYRRF